MTTITARELFEKGRNLLSSNNPVAALACFEKAYSMEKIPGLKSYLGLCCANERGQINEGIRLCNEAIAEDTSNPVHYLHLAKVYIKAGRKQEAIDILRNGLSFGDPGEIRNMLDFLGPRRKPLFSFLPRQHFLNKYAGLMHNLIRRG